MVEPIMKTIEPTKCVINISKIGFDTMSVRYKGNIEAPTVVQMIDTLVMFTINHYFDGETEQKKMFMRYNAGVRLIASLDFNDQVKKDLFNDILKTKELIKKENK